MKLQLGLPQIAAIFVVFALAGCSKRSAYDQCIIENMKGVASDEAARAVREACSHGKSETALPQVKSDDACYVYWDGWNIKAGHPPKGSGYTIYDFAFYGKQTLSLGLPDSMSSEIPMPSTRNPSKDAWPVEFRKFFDSNWPAIEAICRK
jgi:hypothetical protein